LQPWQSRQSEISLHSDCLALHVRASPASRPKGHCSAELETDCRTSNDGRYVLAEPAVQHRPPRYQAEANAILERCKAADGEGSQVSFVAESGRSRLKLRKTDGLPVPLQPPRGSSDHSVLGVSFMG